jgi:hypothetical protein
MLRRSMQWAIFAVSLVLLGLSFPGMFWRADERPLLKKALDLDLKDEPGGVDWSDSLEEGWLKLWRPGRLLHDLKGIGNRWVHENPKVAAKGFAFIILTQFIVLGFLT